MSKSFGVSSGISAGLKYWLFFLCAFILLGYSAYMSVFLSAIGGVAGGWVIAWWQSKEEPTTPEPVSVEATEDNSRKLTGINLANQLRKTKNKNSLLSRRRARKQVGGDSDSTDEDT